MRGELTPPPHHVDCSSCLFLAALALIAPLRAQDEPVHMKPEFPLIFPLVQNGNDVSVKYPVMINPTTVIKPGMVLRTLYVLSYQAPDGSSDLVLAHKGNMEQSYSRDAPGLINQEGKLPPELAHEIDGYRRTVWQVPNNFVLAMAQYPTDTMHLIYSRTGTDRDKDMGDERFSFFDGLFVGAPDGKVTVIAVEKESKAELAGIKAGDEIVSVGGTPTQGSLLAFASAYATAKRTATDNEVPNYPMIVRSGTGEVRSVNIAMPPSLKGGLMDGFDSQLGPTPTPPKPAAP
jgi:membrane-associated protease RseP (regulator of RpoE activity)